MLRGCQKCAYRLRSKKEAERILKELIEVATLYEVEGGGTFIEAKLSLDQVITLCLWGAHCEECEDADAEENGLESESQFRIVR